MTIADELLNDLAAYALRPLDFVYWAYPWGEAGTDLANRDGPVDWQREVLADLQTALLSGDGEAKALSSALRAAYKIAVRSGHDIGKTAFLCWIMQWAVSTREDTRGRATANTEKQLTRVLWAELAKWHRLFIARDFFRHTATAYHSVDPDRVMSWRIDAIPWSEDNPEAFAGLHNYGKRVIVVFEEASGIHDKIWEVVDGVMHEAETELIWIAPGNPTRNHGRFYECWNRFADSWHTYKVDSRSVPFANQEEIAKSIAQWGMDSDYVKVRYLGDFPDAASTQLIDISTIREARTRAVQSLHYEALILGVDVARFGSNESVLTFRRGRDARTIPTERYRGLSTVELGARVAAAITRHEVDGCFIDEGGIGGGVVDFVRHLGHACVGVDFGSKASTAPGGVYCFNKRAEMYVSVREWLRSGGCIADSADLEKQLTCIEYFFRGGKREIQLIPKEQMETEGFDSPDVADALALTFAYPVSPRAYRRPGNAVANDYDPLAYAQLSAWDKPATDPNDKLANYLRTGTL